MGDGDSKSYSEVCKMAHYGPAVFIPKEDCITHVTEHECHLRLAFMPCLA